MGNQDQNQKNPKQQQQQGQPQQQQTRKPNQDPKSDAFADDERTTQRNSEQKGMTDSPELDRDDNR